MAILNSTANNSREQIVLDNLIPTVSDTLADKINNGVYIEKNGNRLLNKKDLTTFMTYATEQARKMLNEQKSGSQAVCVLGDDIMSWAIHYFEEDSIEGKLYNEDGTEYKPPKPAKATTKNNTPSIPHSPPPPKPKPQLSMFDLLDEKATEQPKERAGTDSVASAETPASIPPENDPSVEEIADALQQAVDEKNGVTHNDKQNKIVMDNGKTVDADTDEVLDVEELTESEMQQFDGDIQEPKSLDEPSTEEQTSTISPSSFDEDTVIFLLKLLDGKMDIA
ncbi:Cas9 inhibitor AcrIIA9 family protein [Pumilibacter intestinalis]|uniref:Cas9 inhibitor AcrIIA9 family protein n=1 Tax=Pumilibacter intestinalis TaxID=2941511 RepID=UPI00204083F1|nr:Cas9 inhibitor AcrIIA9 family protein [Pumilibacter intestinalis]